MPNTHRRVIEHAPPRLRVHRPAAIAAGSSKKSEAGKKKAKPAKPPPEPKVDPEDQPYEGPSEEEVSKTLAADAADDTALRDLLASDDRLDALAKENRRMAAEIAVLKLARDGWMNQCNELIRRVKWLKSQLKKATAK